MKRVVKPRSKWTKADLLRERKQLRAALRSVQRLIGEALGYSGG